MSARGFARAVIGLALGATVLTASAHAVAQPNRAPDAPAAPPPGGTPLAVRPTRSLELAADPPATGLGWKLGATTAVGALGIWMWRRRVPSAQVIGVPSLRILRRTAIGVRSELIVIEMDGQRLLLGVTPSTIQNLFIAPLPEDLEREYAAPHPLHADEPLPLRAAPRPPVESVRSVAAGSKPARRQPREPVIEPLEEQARGIRAVTEKK